ncbi:PH domain-containing protein [Alteromonas sp. 14N.309.X.WAT.G.H12]|uniref:PH domain-containing protein n=1 Tax=Alteromonas sp. 14N.309.X.WAT.G.H12 TaxID=3120824 RepID=UPI002FD26BFD
MGDSDRPQTGTGNTPWQRLPLVSILYFIISTTLQFVRQFIVAISVLAYSVSSTDIQGSTFFIPGLVVLVIVIICSGFMSFWFYHYRVHHRHVEIRSGVLKRRNINLPFWRIQNVKIERPFYYRLTQYAVLVLDTAGSAEEEAKIVAITIADAQGLRQQILSAGDNDQDDQDGDAPSEKSENETSPLLTETVINRREVKDLILHGLTNNRVWIILGALAPFYDDIGSAFYGWLDAMGLSLEVLFPSEQVAWWQLSLYVISLMLLALGIMASASVAGAVITYYNYTLSRTSDRYIRRSGLFSLQEVSMRQSRIQKISIKQDWLDYLLKRANLFFEQNKTGRQAEQELHSTSKLLVPSVTYPEAKILAMDGMPANQLYQIPFTRIHRRFISRYLFWFVLPISSLILALAYVELGVLAVLPALAMAVVLSGIVYVRWRRWGIAIDTQYCYVRKGLVGIDRYCFALHKVQQVVISQSLFMRRRDLANIRFILASGEVSVPFLPYQQALYLANRVLWEVESQRRSWM